MLRVAIFNRRNAPQSLRQGNQTRIFCMRGLIFDALFDEGVAFSTLVGVPRVEFRAEGLHFLRILVPQPDNQPASQPASQAPNQPAAQALVEIEHLL